MISHKWVISGFLIVFFSFTAKYLIAQSAPAVPGCEISPEVNQILKDKLWTPEFQKLSYDERNAVEKKVWSELVGTYPRELEPYRHLMWLARDQQALHPEILAQLQEEFQQKAKEHPDDPLMLSLAATVLHDTDTPQSIELDGRAIALAPSFPWAYADLTQIYSRGKTADKDKERANLRKFWNLCPTSTDGSMRWLLVKDMEEQAMVATAERAYLATATDPDALKNYEFLWGLEFRLSAPADYPALRKKIAADLTRLETANPKPGAEWAAFLIGGYKQSGAPTDVVTSREDELLQAYPQSDEALGIRENRWEDAHKQPEDQKDTEAWTKYHAANKAAVQEWMKEFPGAYHELVQRAFFAIYDDDSISKADGIAALDTFVRDTPEHWGPQPWIYMSAAEFLLKHKWQPERALGFLEQTQSLYARENAVPRDNRSQKELDGEANSLIYHNNELYGDLLLAATQAGKPKSVAAIKAAVEAPVPSDAKFVSDYWRNRARLAVLEGRKADGLVYYQLALATRQSLPKFYEGRFKDELADEAHSLWSQLGGSDAAWAAWNKQPPEQAAKTDAAKWEKPTQELPDFALADLSGKTWKLTELHGKVVLINLWATWCGPCNAELPQLEKFYEKVKNRTDLQILTFDIDEDLGLVEPFLKKKGYTFPVVPAYSYTVNLLNGYAIPQSWVIDDKGKWLWTQFGYGGDDAWQQDMQSKLESVETVK